jgi:ADP-ribose pyrophosphatase
MPRKVKAARSSDSDSEANSEKVKSHSEKAGKGKKHKGKKGKNGGRVTGTAQVLSSEVVFEGRVFRVVRDRLIEPGGKEGVRDFVRHNGSAVILAVDNSKSKKDPWIVMERQYRHAANRFLWEVPAGKLDPGEDPLAGAQRELQEETGYRAKKWTELIEYYASPGFLGESMKVFLAEGLVAGDARPEEDELIELRLVKMSELLATIEKGGIMDGKTISSVLLYAILLKKKRRK